MRPTLRQKRLTTSTGLNERFARGSARFRRPAVVATVLLALLTVVMVVLAVDQTWKNTAGDTDFNSGTSWTSGIAPGAGDRALFSGAAVAQPNLSSSASIGGLIFTSSTSSGYNLTSNSTSETLTLTAIGSASGAQAISASNTSGTNTIHAPIILGAAAASTQTVLQTSGGTLLINGDISEANSGIILSKTGGGTLTLTGNNSYGGGTKLTAGTIAVGSDTALGTGQLDFTNGTTLQSADANARTLSNVWTPGSSTSNTIFGAAGTGDLTLNDTTSFGLGGSVKTITVNNNATTISKVFTSTTAGNGITKAGAGTLILKGASTYTGSTTMSAGTLTLGAAGVLPNGSAIILNGGTLSTGTLTGFNETVGTLALTDNSTIALGTGSHSLNFAASSGITWTGSRTLTITGWTGVYNGASSGTSGKIFVGSNASGLTAGQLAQIVFYDGATHLYPATILSTGEVVPGASPTAVKLMNFAAARNGNAVRLQWQSGFEAHNLGYYVYREQNGKRTQITPSIVAGSALMVGGRTAMSAGYSYSWYDELPVGSSQSSAVTYWLEDVDLNGTRTLHGPITPLVARSSQSEESAARSPMLNELHVNAPSSGSLLNGWPAAGAKQASNDVRQTLVCRDESKGTGCTERQAEAYRTLVAQQGIAAVPGVKLAVSKAGWYRVTQPELAAAGIDTNANASQLQLFENGQEVPIKVSGNGVQFTSSDYIEFYGRGLNSPTDAAETYYLVAGNSAGQRVALVNNGPVAPPSGPQNYNYTIERKDRTIYYSAFLNGDAENIFGQVVTSTPGSATLPVRHLDNAAGGQAQLEISLVGVSFEDHHVQVKLNGTDVGIIDFGMLGQPNQAFNVPVSLLHDGDNTVQLTSLGGASDVSLADTLRLTYPHSYTADNDVSSISISSGATTRVAGFSIANVRAVDITDPNNIQEVTPVVAVQADGTYTADLQITSASAAQPHTLLIFADGQMAHPDSIKHNEPSSWKANTNGADYLIITSRDFVSNAQALGQLRNTHGLVTKVIDVEDLYDEFSFGMHSPQAVRDFLQTAASNWTLKPRYVLLMGDASFDPKNYLGRGNADFVPTKLLDTTLMETASDDWLADFNDDGVADLAIGRLPVRTSGDANLMVNKIIAFENAPHNPQRGALLVADRDFEASSSALQGVLPSSMPKQLINRSSDTDSAIHTQIVNSINQGPLLVNYLGHGSNGVWTGARLLSNPDAPSLTNTNGLSLFVMMTCLNGYFQDAYNDSLAEALLRTSGGAVAAWASTGMTEPSGQSLVDMELYRQLFSGHTQRLGDAVRAAKATTGDSDIRRTWTLFGDPAMRLVTAAPTATNGSVGGIITDSQGAPLAGTSITLSGAHIRQTITDSNGKYRFENLDANGAYTVAPTRANYTFSPASRSFSKLGVQTDAVFTGIPDSVAGANAIDSTEFFVRQQYLDFLGREPDEGGFSFWSDQVRSCGNDAACVEIRRINTSAAFFLSIEFQQSGYLVYRTYKSAYGNLPDAPVPIKLNEFLPDTAEIGQGVVVNQAGWEQLLENNKQAFMSDFVQRSRFSSAYPTNMTPADFVDRLFANAGVTPSGSDRAEAIGEFGSAPTTSDVPARARALQRVGENSTLAQMELNRAFVLMQYFGYLRRNPSDTPEPTLDYSGYNFWLGKLNNFNGNFVNAEMVKAFLDSIEYRQRFAP